MTAVEREQERLAPKEDLRPYRGQWVALREGYVVASNVDPTALFDRSDLREDMIIPVPDHPDDVILA